MPRTNSVSQKRQRSTNIATLTPSWRSFDDAIRQAKKAYPDLDFSQLNIDTQPRATAQPIASENTEDLFADNAAPGDEESVPFKNQAQLVDGDVRQPVNVEENVKITSPQQ